MGRRELDELRGQRIAMIFQEPMTAFDPVFSIGEQIVETIVRHEQVSRADAWQTGAWVCSSASTFRTQTCA